MSSDTIFDCVPFGNDCGDGRVDPDGPDNVFGNFNDEECDDGKQCEADDGTRTQCTTDSECT